MTPAQDARMGNELPNLQGQFTIQQASRLLEVPAPTIRSWERRYGIPEAGRSTGGHRRYSLEQIQLLRKMRDAISRGQPAAEAAALVKAAATTSFEPLIQEFMEAAHALEPASVLRVLDSAHTTLGLDRTVDEVVFPAMQQIGRDWRVGRCDIAHEHLATQTTRSWLSAITLQADTAPLDCRPVLLTCGPRDPHTLGLEAIGALLRQRGADCRLLGACVPAQSLYLAVQEVAPSAVLLVSHLSVARRTAIESLRAVRHSRAQLFYAGNAFLSRQARQGVPGQYLGDHVSRAADLVTSVITGADLDSVRPARPLRRASVRDGSPTATARVAPAT